MNNTDLKPIALIIFLIIVLLIFIILYFYNSNANSNEKNNSTKKNNSTLGDIVNTLYTTTPAVNNEIKVITTNDKKKFKLDLFNYKHTKFLKNLDNSIEFCIDSNRFLLADYITQYKLLYIELYNIKKNEEKINPDVDLNTNEDFLLKLDRLDKLNNIIQKQN